MSDESNDAATGLVTLEVQVDFHKDGTVHPRFNGPNGGVAARQGDCCRGMALACAGRMKEIGDELARNVSATVDMMRETGIEPVSCPDCGPEGSGHES